MTTWILASVVFVYSDGQRLLFDSGEAPREGAPVERNAMEAECIEDTKERLRRAVERQGFVLYEEHVEGGAIVHCEPDRRLRQATGPRGSRLEAEAKGG